MTFDEGRFGKFEIDAKLGSGGMAEVFRCRLAGIGGFEKWVVVKRILSQHANDPYFVQMFMDEARLSANLNHPNIAQTFEIDEIDGIAYIAMEYVKGPTLSQLIRKAWREEKVHLGHFALVVAQVCEGLHHAHTALDSAGEPMSIVHRDVSPQNVIVSLDGVPKLLDFGVALGRGRIAKTEAGTLKGKLRYMAPEQISQGGAVDHRVDIFSAGVMLYEATVGRNPHGGSDTSEVTLLKNVMDGLMQPPSMTAPNYPPELEAIVMKAIHPKPEERYQSARELHDALVAFTAGGPHASSQRAVAAWVNELFPNFEVTATRTGDRTPGTTPIRSGGGAQRRTQSSDRWPAPRRTPSAGSLPSFEINTEATARPSTRWPWVAVGLVVLACLGTLLYLQGRRSAQVSGAVTIIRQVADAGGEVNAFNPDDAAKAYLDEAEKYAESSRYTLALQLLQQAREQKIQDPALNIRLMQVGDSIEVRALLYKANNLLERNDLTGAADQAKLVLERDPTQAQALALISKVRQAREARKPVPTTPSKERRDGVGFLFISSTPSGMVFVDDEPVGRTPLKGRPQAAGIHNIQIRENGYYPAETTLRVESGKKVTLSLTLQAKGEKQLIEMPEETGPESTLQGTKGKPPAGQRASNTGGR